jgi:hypothetical protein
MDCLTTLIQYCGSERLIAGLVLLLSRNDRRRPFMATVAVSKTLPSMSNCVCAPLQTSGGRNLGSDAITSRLEEMKSQATILSEAYRLRLVGRLWWANLFLAVLPAASATAAAIAALKNTYPYLTAGLAGGAAVLTAIHRALKCEEYQAECLRLDRLTRTSQ